MTPISLCGIYCIENVKTGAKYIGKAKNIKLRWNKHKSSLRKNKHENFYLQNSWNKHGEDCFIFYIVEECTEYELNEKEIMYIHTINTKRPRGYNLTDGGDGGTGRFPSKKTRAKISNTLTLIFSNPINHPMFGRKHSSETKSKMSISRKNPSYKTRKKMSDSAIGNSSHLGFKHSEETKKKLSSKIRGKKKNKKSSSKYFGVTWDKKNNKWLSNIWISKKVYIGRYEEEITAALAYDKVCWDNYNDISLVNFPEKIGGA